MIFEILKEATSNSLNTIFQITVIVIPVMVVLRVAKEAEVLNKISNYLEPFTKRIYLSKEATFPLIVGTVFGLTYGAGVILQSAKEGHLDLKDLFLLNVFLGINHAIFEDTFVFMALGANGWVVLITRTIMAIMATYILGRWFVKRKESVLRWEGLPHNKME